MKIIKTIKGSDKNYSPIWLMRQAGRYLPEYRRVRESSSGFLSMCYNPKVAAEITMQPIRRFDLDAAIIFSDILVIADALNIFVEYVAGCGPRLTHSISDIEQMNVDDKVFLKKLNPVYDAISLTREVLDEDKALIGFSGAPWTLAAYIFEGGASASGEFLRFRTELCENTELVESVIDLLVDKISLHLIHQIEAGADIVKIFDSHAGITTPRQFERYVVAPTKKIVKCVKDLYPNIPIIGFPRGAGEKYTKYANETGVDVLAIDQFTSARSISMNLVGGVTMQGNLDNLLLSLDVGSKSLERSVEEVFNDFGGSNFIFNLGHGVLPSTPVENISKIISIIRNR